MNFFDIINSINPFASQDKNAAAWNALMAAYTLEHISITASKEDELNRKAVQLLSLAKGRPISYLEMIAILSSSQRYLLFSLAMKNIGIRPAIGDVTWKRVKNSYDELSISTEIVDFTRQEMEKEFQVKFPDLY